MYFFIWGHIKALIYTSRVESEEDLIACIVEAEATIRQQPAIIQHTHQSLLRHHRLYMEFGGCTFEHLL
jgi:hypothetical protein